MKKVKLATAGAVSSCHYQHTLTYFPHGFAIYKPEIPTAARSSRVRGPSPLARALPHHTRF